MDTYRVQLQDFEGPLDLLLFFIQRDELDIHDIPIAKIADEFLEYVRLLKEVDLDKAGDFIYMAALLINLKARMLFPVQETGEEDEFQDPRRELVDRLLEYVRYKEASTKLMNMHELRSEHFTRGLEVLPGTEQFYEAEPVLRVSVFDLVSSISRLLSKPSEEPLHTVSRFMYSVEEQQVYILKEVCSKGRTAFHELMRGFSKEFVIVSFLAVLELVRRSKLKLFVHSGHELFFMDRMDKNVQFSSGISSNDGVIQREVGLDQ